jgi:tRNA G26 N,N-dimethylase Trm1
MSINGPWDEDPMWVPDLQDSELAMEVVQCLRCQELEAELESWKHTASMLMAEAEAQAEYEEARFELQEQYIRQQEKEAERKRREYGKPSK